MRKIAAVTLGLLAMSLAHADSYLLPTDILKAGALDLELSISHSEHSENVNFKGNSGRENYESTAEDVTVRYGLGDNWHVGAALPYSSQHIWHRNYSNPTAHFVYQSGEGKQNLRAWAKYGFVNDKDNPLSVTGQILFEPNTSGRSSSYTGRLATGWKSSDTLKLYGTLAVTVESSSANADATSLFFGAYKDVSDEITLIPNVGYVHFYSTDYFLAMDQYFLGLSSNIKISDDTYVSPGISFYRTSSVSSRNGDFHQATSTNGQSVGISLYRSF